MADIVKFDPGIGELTVDFNEFINNVYSQLMSFPQLNQKRTRFRLYANKITKYLKNNIAFYLGCLLWAYNIKKENENSPKEIVGNVFLGLTEEQKEDYDYMIQVNFMENYFDNYERDFQYYTGKKTEIPELYRTILEMYGEFLELNKGFVGTKTTKDLVLPAKLDDKKFDFDIKQKINEAIEKKDLEILLNIDNLAL